MATRPSTSSSSSSIGSDYSIQLLCAVPGTLPRSSKPTPQKITLVATILSTYLQEQDLPHAFLGRYALELRGAPYSSKWVEVDVSRPNMGGTARVREIIGHHPDFAVHSEIKEGFVDRLLVSHKCGIYIRMSVGAVAHLRRKVITISVPTAKSQAPALLPLLTPARQFLETVVTAAGADGRAEDAEDLIWLHANFKMELLQEPSTLKKTWDQGRLQRVIEIFPVVSEVVVDLGLAAISGGGHFEVPESESRTSYSS